MYLNVCVKRGERERGGGGGKEKRKDLELTIEIIVFHRRKLK